MYLDHFDLHSAPFTLAQNLRFLYQSKAFEETMAHLVYGLEAGEDIVLITGEIGAGKTMALNYLISNLDNAYQVALINTTKVAFLELLKLLLGELGGTPPPGADRADMILALRGASAELRESGRKLLVIVDEAQNLDGETLESLRLLTNSSADGRQPLQLILAGQPGLRANVERPELAQLRQRIRVDYHLETLDLRETGEYIRRRLEVAGREEPLFQDKAVEVVHRLSGGIPRLVNVLADKALLAAFVDGDRKVKASHVPRDEAPAPPQDAPGPAPTAAAPPPPPPAAPATAPPPAPPAPAPGASRGGDGTGRRLAVAAVAVLVIAALAWGGWTLFGEGIPMRTGAPAVPAGDPLEDEVPAVTAAADTLPVVEAAVEPERVEIPPAASAARDDGNATVPEQAPVDRTAPVEEPEPMPAEPEPTRAEPVAAAPARDQESAPAPAPAPEPAPPAELVVEPDESDVVLDVSGPRLQVGSFRNYERARIMRNRLAWVSDRTTIQKKRVRSRVWYIVYSGPWDTLDEVRNVDRLVRRYDIADETILIRE